MSPRAEALFADYADAHRTAGNRSCHAVGIPLIVVAIVAALAEAKVGAGWSAAEPVIGLASLAAIAIDAPLGAIFAAFLLACDFGARALEPALGRAAIAWGAAALFAVGWVFQLVGHARYEKNRPAFLRNLRHLLVGPLWIARKAFFTPD